MRPYIRRLLFMVLAGVVAFAVQVATAQAAIADVTLKDVQTIVRTIGFVENSSASDSVMAIIYNPNNAESLQNARQMENLIKEGKKNLEPRLVPVQNMDSLEGSDYAFVTDGLQPYYNSIKAALIESKTLSFTLDRACVDQHYCAVYISSAGRVQIVVNKMAADKVDAQFKYVFLMMITVI